MYCGKLTKDDNTILPSDVVQAVFWALYLSREKKKAVLPHLSQEIPETISVVCLYIANRFQEYELMASTLGSLAEHKELKSPRSNNGKILDGAAATASDTGADGTNRQGGGRGRGGGRGGGRRGGKPGRRKWPDNGRTSNNNTDRRPPGRRKHVRSCTFCKAKKRPDTAHIIGFCQWLSSTSKSDLLTTLPNVCLGCLCTKDGAHRCPENLKEGGDVKYFCTICRLNNRICRVPATHT